METETKINDTAAVEQTEENKPVISESSEPAAGDNGDNAADLTARLNEQCRQIEELSLKLFDTKMRLELLLSGIAKEKLNESAALAAGLCKSGKTPGEAAAEIAGAYPHLRAVQRIIPQFAASGSGADDGFSAIRGIFAKR